MKAKSPPSVRDRLLASARTLISRCGLRQATTRRTAVDADVSVSLVNYHFGDRNGLIRAVYEQALAEHRAWLGAAVADPADVRPGPEHLSGWLIALLVRRAMHTDLIGLERTLWINAARVPGLEPVAQAWMATVLDFAARTEALFRLPPGSRDHIAEFHLSTDLLVSPSMLDQTGLTLACLTAARFADKLTGAAASGDTADRVFEVWRAALMNGDRTRGPASTTWAEPGGVPERILQAALRVVAHDGADALTHRSVAKQAGVPLSATTRHFASRADIVHGAFERAYAALVGNRDQILSPPQGLEPDSLAELIAENLLGPGDEIGETFAIIDELFILAMNDPALAQLSRSLIASRGETSLAVLRAALPEPALIARCDGFLWSLCTFGMIAHARLLPADMRREHLARRTRARLSLFSQ